jgi:hypothetical protein
VLLVRARMLWSGACPRYQVASTWLKMVDLACPGGATTYSRGALIGGGSASPAAASARSRNSCTRTPVGRGTGSSGGAVALARSNSTARCHQMRWCLRGGSPQVYAWYTSGQLRASCR